MEAKRLKDMYLKVETYLLEHLGYNKFDDMRIDLLINPKSKSIGYMIKVCKDMESIGRAEICGNEIRINQ